MPCLFPWKKTHIKPLKATQKSQGIKCKPAHESDPPRDIITIILCLLSVKSLLRFKCISKLWCSMIGSRYFLRNTIDNNTKMVSLILQGKKVYSVTCNSYDHDHACIKLDAPFGGDTKILGSCNGLLCVGEQTRKYDSYSKISLWNPSINKFHMLPVEPIEVERHFLLEENRNHFPPDVFHAFGYDSISDDYKVLRIVLPRVVSTDHEVKLYSSKANSWRKIDVPSYVLHSFQPVLTLRYSHYALVHETFHWLMICDKEYIVSFDVQNEHFCTLPLPNMGLQNLPRKLGVFRQCLCLVDFVRGIDRFNIWVMKEYGVKDSWVTLFSFTDSMYSNLMPFTLEVEDDDDKVLLLQISTVVKYRWYDLKKDRMSKDVTISDLSKIDSIYTLERSMVFPLNHGSENDQMMLLESENDNSKLKRGRTYFFHHKHMYRSSFIKHIFR